MSTIDIHIAKNMYRDIERVLTIKSVQSRSQIADVYAAVLNKVIPIKPPIAMLKNIEKNLRKKVSNTCSSCLSQKEMIKYMNIAKALLRSYNKLIFEWLKSKGINMDGIDDSNKNISVHDLKPNI